VIAALLLIPVAFVWPCVILLFPFLFLLSGIGMGPYRPSEKTTSMLDLPPPEGQFPVMIRLLHRKFVYGSDCGVLSVMNEGLLFTGEQTDFSLTRETAGLGGLYIRTGFSKRPYIIGKQVDFALIWAAGYQNFHLPVDRAKQPFFEISFQVDGFNGSLEVTPLAHSRREAILENRELELALYLWDQKRCRDWESTTAPPITIQPGVIGKFVRTLLIVNPVIMACLAALPALISIDWLLVVELWAWFQLLMLPKVVRSARVLWSLRAPKPEADAHR
jgi:hypothetical protein